MAAIPEAEIKVLQAKLEAVIQEAELSKAGNRAKQARTEFGELKKALPTGLGGTGTDAWEKLAEDDQKKQKNALQALVDDLMIELTGSRMLMSSNPAPSWVIVGLLVLAMTGIIVDLVYIAKNWEDAITAPTASSAPPLTGTQSKSKATEPAKSAETPAKGKAVEPTKSPEGPTKGKAAEPTKSPDAAAKGIDEKAAKSSDQPAEAPQGKDATTKADKGTKQVEPDAATDKAETTTANPTGPKQLDVLIMVILLGTLGGLIHLASSLTIYVGNRDLKRSWIVYYVLAPFQGAALAPLLYLLLKSAVLTPQAANGASTANNLNLTAIYAFAGLTGLFAKQAIEKLADVFATLFSSMSQAKDKTKDGANAKK